MVTTTIHRTEGPVATTVALDTPTGRLEGTLTMPSGALASHVALVLAGSGPMDRDGNSTALPGKNDCLRLLAEGLAGHGIACLRIDKRGVGASRAAGEEESELRLDTYVEDAVAWLDLLRSDPRFHHVSVIGHSEGSLVAMLATNEVRVDTLISLEGAGRPAHRTIAGQLSAQLPPPLMARVREVLAALADGRLVDPLPSPLDTIPAATSLFRPSVQPYLMSWFRYDPAAVLGAMTIPVLIVHGTTDLQVDLSDADRLAAANPWARLAVIVGMNHVLKSAPLDRDGNLATYTRPDLPLAPDLLPAISSFLTTAELDHRIGLERGADRW